MGGGRGADRVGPGEVDVAAEVLGGHDVVGPACPAPRSSPSEPTRAMQLFSLSSTESLHVLHAACGFWVAWEKRESWGRGERGNEGEGRGDEGRRGGGKGKEGGTISLAGDDGELGDSGLSVCVQQLGACTHRHENRSGEPKHTTVSTYCMRDAHARRLQHHRTISTHSMQCTHSNAAPSAHIHVLSTRST
eukprot:429439-Rhodomonas_salina.2